MSILQICDSFSSRFEHKMLFLFVTFGCSGVDSSISEENIKSRHQYPRSNPVNIEEVSRFDQIYTCLVLRGV